MKVKEIKFEEIKIGNSVSFYKKWTEKDVTIFAELSGDQNPLHMDESYAKTTRFKKRLVHGFLAASSFSRLLGMYLPGKNCLYLKQSLVFRNPIFIGDDLKVTGTVTNKSQSTNILDLEMKIYNQEIIVIEGQAKVQVLSS